MGLDKRVEKNIQSISNLKNLLIEVIKDPQNYMEDKILLDSLLSQGKLAKYENPEANIFATSINTMKRLSSYPNPNPNCDFEALDKLRTAALDKIQNKTDSIENKPTYNKPDLIIRIEQLENELNINKGAQLLLLKTISEINKTLKIVQNTSNTEEVKEHLNLMSNKIKKVMSLDTAFLINNEDNNVISYDFRKKD